MYGHNISLVKIRDSRKTRAREPDEVASVADNRQGTMGEDNSNLFWWPPMMGKISEEEDEEKIGLNI